MSQDTGIEDLPLFALIGLGSNVTSTLGGPQTTLELTFAALESDSVKLHRRSQIYQTPAFPPGNGPDFANAAAVLRTSLQPTELLDHLHTVESEVGRERKKRWAPRPLDLDLLAFGQRVLPDRATFQEWVEKDLKTQQSEVPDDLILPHPRMHERSFVLVPLHEVAPDWTHPVFDLSVAQMLQARPEQERNEVTGLK